MKDDIAIDLDSISFLLETERRNLLGKLSIGVAKYQGAIDAINARSRLHLVEPQPCIERAVIVDGRQYTFHQIKEALGPRLYGIMNQATDQVFEHTAEALAFLEAVSNRLTEALRKEFPGRSIISFATADVGGDEHNKPTACGRSR